MRWARQNPGRPLSDAYKPNRTRTRRRVRPTELRVSYRKAVDGLTTHLDATLERIERASGIPLPIDGRQLAEEGLRVALSPKQLDHLKEAA